MEPISLRPQKTEAYRDYPMSMDDCCPTVHLSGSTELADIPEEGTITFKYKRRSVTISDGKKPVHVELKLLSVEDAVEGESEEEEDADEPMDSGAAIDKLLSSAEDEVD